MRYAYAVIVAGLTWSATFASLGQRDVGLPQYSGSADRKEPQPGTVTPAPRVQPGNPSQARRPTAFDRMTDRPLRFGGAAVPDSSSGSGYVAPRGSVGPSSGRYVVPPASSSRMTTETGSMGPTKSTGMSDTIGSTASYGSSTNLPPGTSPALPPSAAVTPNVSDPPAHLPGSVAPDQPGSQKILLPPPPTHTVDTPPEVLYETVR